MLGSMPRARNPTANQIPFFVDKHKRKLKSSNKTVRLYNNNNNNFQKGRKGGREEGKKQ